MGKERGLSHLEFLRVQSWNHSENWTHLDESHLKIDSLECNSTDKKPLFGKTRWATHKLAYMHRATMETVPVSQWEDVSAYYSLSFQSSTFLGFIARGTLPGVRPATQTEGIVIPRQQSAETPAETGALETGEKCAQQFLCPGRTSVPVYNFLCVLEMAARWTLQFQPQRFLTIRELSVLVFSIRSL